VGLGLKRIADECAEARVTVKFEVLKTGFLVTFARQPALLGTGSQKVPKRVPIRFWLLWPNIQR